MFSTGLGRYFFYLNFLGRLGLTCKQCLRDCTRITLSSVIHVDRIRFEPAPAWAVCFCLSCGQQRNRTVVNAILVGTFPFRILPFSLTCAIPARLPPLGVSQRGRAVLSKAITSWYVYMCVTEKYVADYVIAERTHRFREGVRHPLKLLIIQPLICIRFTPVVDIMRFIVLFCHLLIVIQFFKIFF